MGSKWDSIWVPTLTGAFLTKYEGVINSSWSYPINKKIDSTGEFEKTVDLGTVGQVRQFAGRREFTAWNDYTMTFQNIPYELSTQIDRDDYRRDKIGMAQAKVEEIGAKMADHINKLTASQIVANPNCCDGTAFFGSGHTVSANVNALTSSQVPALASSVYSGLPVPPSSTKPSPVQMADVLTQALGVLYSFVDEAGDPINGGAKQFTIVTSNPSTWGAVQTALTSMQLYQGTTNSLKDFADAKGLSFSNNIDSRLGSTTSSVFYMFRTDSEIKPFIWTEELPVEMEFLGPGSDTAFKENAYMFGAKTVRNVGVGRYQHALKLTLS